MNPPIAAIRTPYDPDYTALLGRAVYLFAYYEWLVIYLIQQFRPGFVHRYCRGSSMTSGKVKAELEKIVDDPATSYTGVPGFGRIAIRSMSFGARAPTWTPIAQPPSRTMRGGQLLGAKTG